jgi:hypothetical protein
MDIIQWLERNAVGFAALDQPERDAPMHFSLLWSYFEAEALHANGSSNAVANWIRSLHQVGKLDPREFSQAIDYFKNRYFQGGHFTHHFDRLNLRANDEPNLVKAVLSGNNLDPVESIVVLFIVIYRFRNNYFHGPKWAYSLQDQLGNFTFASNSLVAAMDMWRA